MAPAASASAQKQQGTAPKKSDLIELKTLKQPTELVRQVLQCATLLYCNVDGPDTYKTHFLADMQLA